MNYILVCVNVLSGTEVCLLLLLFFCPKMYSTKGLKAKKYVKSKGGMARGLARAQGHQKTPYYYYY